MAGQTINVSVLADTKQFSSAMKNISSESGIGRLGTAMQGMGKKVALGLGGAAATVTAFSVSAIKDAGNLEQSIGAIDTVFGKNAGQMHKWSAQAAQSVGLTKNEFNELGTLIGAQLKNGGTAMADLAPKTNDLIKLGGDLSSMFGGTTKQAVEALSSALKGERDPIERYGVSLNQARIDAKAAELGFKKVGGSLSAEANQAATLALIMEQTSDAHGNFAKEANTLQGQQQRLTAEWVNMKTTIGTALLPIVTKAFTWINTNAVPAVKNLIGAFQNGGIGDFAAKLGLDKIEPVFKRVIDGFRSFVSAFQSGDSAAAGGFLDKLGAGARQVGDAVASAVSTIGPALASLAETLATKLGPILSTIVQTALPLFAQILQSVASIVAQVVTAVGELISALADRLAPIVEWLLPVLAHAFQNMLGIIQPVLSFLAALIRTVTAVIKGDWGAAWQGIKDMFAAVWQLIKNIVTNAIASIKVLLSAAWTAIKAVAGAAWNGIKALIGGVWNAIRSVVSANIARVKAVISTAWNAVRANTSAAWSTIRNAISAAVDNIRAAVAQRVQAVIQTFRSLPGQILSAVSGFGSMLIGAGRSLIQGLISGITEKIGAVRDTLTGLTSKLTSWKGPPQRDKTLLSDAGRLIIQGFIDGMEGQYGGVRASLAGLTSDVASTSFRPPTMRTPAPQRTLQVGGRSTGGGAASTAPAPVTVIVRDDSGIIARFVDGRIDTARAHDARVATR